MAWSELTGSQHLDESLRLKDYIITYEAALAEGDPAIGSTHNEISGLTELSSTGLVDVPEAVQISKIKKVTATKKRVTVRLRGDKKES